MERNEKRKRLIFFQTTESSIAIVDDNGVNDLVFYPGYQYWIRMTNMDTSIKCTNEPRCYAIFL